MKTTIRRTETRVTVDLVWFHEDWRAAQAQMHRLAADLEEGSRGERWAVVVDGGVGSLGRNRTGGSVALELADGGAEEGGRAEALLRDLARQWSSR